MDLNAGDRPAGVKTAEAVQQIGAGRRAAIHVAQSGGAAATDHTVDGSVETVGTGGRHLRARGQPRQH